MKRFMFSPATPGKIMGACAKIIEKVNPRKNA
jgi:hypothetical protein